MKLSVWSHGRTKNYCKNSNHLIIKLEKEVELFTWEKLDYAEKVKEAFGL